LIGQQIAGTDELLAFLVDWVQIWERKVLKAVASMIMISPRILVPLIPPKTIITVLIIFLLSSCSLSTQAPDPKLIRQETETYRKQELELVRATINDPVRVDRFLSLIAERDELIAQSTETIKAYREQMSKLNADYSADRESFESLLTDLSRRRETAQAQFVAVISRMKATTTSEEWKAIAKFQTRKLNPRELTYRSTDREG
jgi:hypothetical protein